MSGRQLASKTGFIGARKEGGCEGVGVCAMQRNSMCKGNVCSAERVQRRDAEPTIHKSETNKGTWQNVQKGVAYVQDSDVHKKDRVGNRRSAAGLRGEWKGPGGTCALPGPSAILVGPEAHPDTTLGFWLPPRPRPPRIARRAPCQSESRCSAIG